VGPRGFYAVAGVPARPRCGRELSTRGGDVATARQAHVAGNRASSSTDLNAAIALRVEPPYIPVGLYGIRFY
jgi:hypothetical protein